jgi:hypothetical protein
MVIVSKQIRVVFGGLLAKDEIRTRRQLELQRLPG